jgi:fatty-acyl-CoA synthase
LPRDEERGFRFVSPSDAERYYSFAALEQEAHRRARRLLEAGLRPKQHVALIVDAPEDFVPSFLGAVCAGIVPIPIYARASQKPAPHYTQLVSHIVRATGAVAVLTTRAASASLSELSAASAAPSPRLLNIEDVFAPGDAHGELPTVVADDICFLQFTSGSTSMPKGVIVRHRNLLANARAFLGPSGLDRRQSDVGVTWLPLFHDMGLIGFALGTLVADIPTVFLHTEAFARRPRIWMAAMSRYRGTIGFAPSFAYALAAKASDDQHLETLDLSCVRVLGCGAEPVNAEVLRRFAKRFAGAGLAPNVLLPCYGLAESTLAVSFSKPGRPFPTDIVNARKLAQGDAVETEQGPADISTRVELVGCGRPFPDHALEVRDSAGRVLPERMVGEICVSGPSVATGYISEAGVEEFPGGWVCTGDLGYLADGTLYVCGRIKDLIIVRGANFHAQDIEWSLLDLPGLRRSAVVAFGVDSLDGEELGIAAECNAEDAEQLRQAIVTRIAEGTGLRVGRVVTVRVGSLPKTSSGKIQRAKVRSLFQHGQLAEHAC